MTNIEVKVQESIQKIIEGIGYELYDVIYEKEAKDYYLRIFIDNQKGISLEDCEKVNDAISDVLDTVDCLKEPYFLEVSSPGIERIVRTDKHLQANLEKEIEIKLFKPIEINQNDGMKMEQTVQNKKQKEKIAKTKELIGFLKAFDAEQIELETSMNKNTIKIAIPRSQISLIKLKYNWK